MWAKFTWHIEFMDCRYIFRVQCMCVCSCSKFMCRVLYVRATWNLCTKHGDLEKRSPSAGYKFLIIFSMNGRWTMYTHVYSSLSARHSVRVWLCRPVRRHYPRVRWATMWPHASDRQSSNLAMTNADSRPTNCCWFSRRPTAARRRWPRVAADRWMFPCRLSFFRTSFGWFSWWPACRRRKEFCCLSPREKRWREREKKWSWQCHIDKCHRTTDASVSKAAEEIHQFGCRLSSFDDGKLWWISMHYNAQWKIYALSIYDILCVCYVLENMCCLYYIFVFQTLNLLVTNRLLSKLVRRLVD